MLRAALALHPDATAKRVGSGITHFSVRSADFGTSRFWVNRVEMGSCSEKFPIRAASTASGDAFYKVGGPFMTVRITQIFHNDVRRRRALAQAEGMSGCTPQQALEVWALGDRDFHPRAAFSVTG